MTFGRRLRAAMEARGPLCAGIDPHPSLLAAWGLPDDPDGLARFTHGAIEAVGGEVAALKPQSAFYERHGSAGIAVLERALVQAREAGALVILDVKRGDIGSTMQAYADAYARPGSPLFADAVTASPYLGFESLRPLLDTAAAAGAGVFVLARTSNAEGPQVQLARGDDGRTVADGILERIRQENRAAAGDAGGDAMGSVGAVVGATVEGRESDTGRGGRHPFDIEGPLLAPGIGAQGGRPEDLRRVFGSALPYVLASSSREILSAGPDPGALRSAARRTAQECAAVLAG